MEIFSKNMTTLEHSLDMRMENQRIVASNIANMDTPGYTAQKMDFQASMQNALRGAQAPEVIAASPTPAGMDGNNVDLDYEMGQMTANKILFSVQSQIMGDKFRQLNTILDMEK